MIDKISSGSHGVEINLKTTQPSFFAWNQDVDHARTLNRRRSVSGIIHTLLDVDVCWKVQIQPDI